MEHSINTTSLAENPSFFGMGGYGAYVWGAYGFTGLMLGLMLLGALAARRRALKARALSGQIDA